MEDLARVILKKYSIRDAALNTFQIFNERNLKIKTFVEGLRYIKSNAQTIDLNYKNKEIVRLYLNNILRKLQELNSKMRGIKANGNILNVILYLAGTYGRMETAYNKGYIENIHILINGELYPAIDVGERIIRSM